MQKAIAVLRWLCLFYGLFFAFFLVAVFLAFVVFGVAVCAYVFQDGFHAFELGGAGLGHHFAVDLGRAGEGRAFVFA